MQVERSLSPPAFCATHRVASSMRVIGRRLPMTAARRFRLIVGISAATGRNSLRFIEAWSLVRGVLWLCRMPRRVDPGRPRRVDCTQVHFIVRMT